LALVVNQCARYFEDNMCLVPQEKHSLLRAMSYGLYLMDGDNEKLNVFKSKKISLSPFQKFFKVRPPSFALHPDQSAAFMANVPTLCAPQKYPIVPLYGDMQFSLEQTIKSCPHYDEKTWGLPLEDRKLAVEYEIQGQIDSIRTEYNMYLAKFTSMIHQVPHPPTPSHSRLPLPEREP
jgi:cytoplasmic FMR1 interacting protein